MYIHVSTKSLALYISPQFEPPGFEILLNTGVGGELFPAGGLKFSEKSLPPPPTLKNSEHATTYEYPNLGKHKPKYLNTQKCDKCTSIRKVRATMGTHSQRFS